MHNGLFCIEEIEDPIMQKVFYVDKLVDELAKGETQFSTQPSTFYVRSLGCVLFFGSFIKFSLMKRFAVLLISFSLYFTACTKADDSPTPPLPQTISVTGVSATSLAEGDTLIISGQNFNPSASGNVVKVNGTTVSVITATTTALTIQVPLGSVSGNMAIAVTANGQTGTYSFTFSRLGTLMTILDPSSISRLGGIAVSPAGDLYFSDPLNGCIRKLSANGTLSLYAGVTPTAFPTDGPISSATFRQPGLITFDKAGNLYVIDNTSLLRKISTNGQVTTFPNVMFIADGIAADGFGNIYATSKQGASIYKITQDGSVSLLAGASTGYPDGTGGSISFQRPTGITCDAAGNVYVVDEARSNVRKISPSGNVTALAGIPIPGYADGTAFNAKFSQPCSITIDPQGNIYVLDRGNQLIRKIDPAGMVTTVVGKRAATNFPPLSGNLNIATLEYSPDGYIAADPSGNLYLGMRNSTMIRKLTF